MPLAGAALLGACASQPPAPCEAPAQYNAQAAAEYGTLPAGPAALASIGRRGARVLDEPLSARLYVADVQAGRRPNGAAEVATRVLNCTAAPIAVESAVQFLDANGAQAEAPSVWRRVFVPPRTDRVLSELSTGPRPASFVIELREAR